MLLLFFAARIFWATYLNRPITNDDLAFGLLLMWLDLAPRSSGGPALTWNREEGWRWHWWRKNKDAA